MILIFNFWVFDMNSFLGRSSCQGKQGALYGNHESLDFIVHDCHNMSLAVDN